MKPRRRGKGRRRSLVLWGPAGPRAEDAGGPSRLLGKTQSEAPRQLCSFPTSQEPEFCLGSLESGLRSGRRCWSVAGPQPPARGAAAARPSQSGGGSPARNLWPAGWGLRGGRRAAGEVRAEPGREVCSRSLPRPCTAGERNAVTREPRLGGNKTPASHPGSPD